MVRYLPTGALDASLSGDGIVTTDVSDSIDKVASLIQQADGKLVAAGYGNGTFDDFVLVRYLADGEDSSIRSLKSIARLDFWRYWIAPKQPCLISRAC